VLLTTKSISDPPVILYIAALAVSPIIITFFNKVNTSVTKSIPNLLGTWNKTIRIHIIKICAVESVLETGIELIVKSPVAVPIA
jgi:hypothetical protein